MQFLLGIDEAGRGPLAGPVAVGLVAVPEGYDVLTVFPGLNDSKKLTEKKREALHLILVEEAKKGNIRVKVCFGSESAIDTKGIANVIRESLARGVRTLALETRGVRIMLDGSLKAPEEYEQETIIGGDAKVPAIMLGALAAKVARDHLMLTLATEHPLYGFETHKGYGTKSHIEAIRTHGLSNVHRRSFCKSILQQVS